MRKLVLFIIFAMLLSCSSDKYIIAYIHNVNGDQWNVQDTIEQKIFIQDTAQLYQLALFISTTDDTEIVNISGNIYYKDTCTMIDTFNIYLSSKLRRTLIAKERKDRFLLMDSIKFDSIGDYRFRFSPLKEVEISAVGVYVFEQ